MKACCAAYWCLVKLWLLWYSRLHQHHLICWKLTLSWRSWTTEITGIVCDYIYINIYTHTIDFYLYSSSLVIALHSIVHLCPCLSITKGLLLLLVLLRKFPRDISWLKISDRFTAHLKYLQLKYISILLPHFPNTCRLEKKLKKSCFVIISSD